MHDVDLDGCPGADAGGGPLAPGGAVQAVDVLREITANTGSTLANRQSFMQGTSQVSLRGSVRRPR